MRNPRQSFRQGVKTRKGYQTIGEGRSACKHKWNAPVRAFEPGGKTVHTVKCARCDKIRLHTGELS